MMSGRKFAWLMAKTGCIGFGGGSALIPVIEDTFLKKEGLDTRENYDRDVIVASITPGALPVEIAGSLGRRNFGRKGMVAGAVMMALPGALAALLIFTMLSTVQSQLLMGIKLASVGISSFIIFLLAKYITDMLKANLRESKARLRKSLFVMFSVCLLTCGNNLYKLLGIAGTSFLSVSTLYVLLAVFFVAFYSRGERNLFRIPVAAILCAVYLLGHGKAGIFQGSRILYGTEILMVILAVYGGMKSIRLRKWMQNIDKSNLIKDQLVWLVFFVVLSLPAFFVSKELLLFAGKGIFSAWVSFGGGDAYLTIAEGLFVDSGMIAPAVYYGQIVAVVNILPGSILCKTLLGVGYYIGYETGGSIAGILFAVAGFACSIAASGSSFGLIYYLYDSLMDSKIFLLISRWIRPVIAGFLINIMLSLCNQNLSVQEYAGVSGSRILLCTLLLAAFDYIAGRLGKIRNIWLLLLNLLVVFVVL